MSQCWDSLLHNIGVRWLLLLYVQLAYHPSEFYWYEIENIIKKKFQQKLIWESDACQTQSASIHISLEQLIVTKPRPHEPKI